MERAAADDVAVIFEHDEIAHVLADFGEGARQQGSVAGVGRDQFVDLLGVGQKGFTRAHGRPPAWFPLSAWRRRWPAELAPAPYRRARRG